MHLSCIGIDIDDHQRNGWVYLASVYNYRLYLISGDGQPPKAYISGVLDHPILEILIITQVRELVHGVLVEINSTADIGLRIPVEQNLLDSETLHPEVGKQYMVGVFRDLRDFNLAFFCINYRYF